MRNEMSDLQTLILVSFTNARDSSNQRSPFEFPLLEENLEKIQSDDLV